MDVRYARQIDIAEIGTCGQEALSKARVLVVGAGGLGSPILFYLASMGIGRIGIVDDDVVSVSNLQRQILYTTDEVGQSKAELASLRLKALNPNIEISVYSTRLDDSNAEDIIPQYDILVDACDNYPTRLLLDSYSIRYGIPYVYGSVEDFEGQVSVFNTLGAGSYRDFVGDDAGISPNRSVNVLGAMPGVIGSLEAMEVVKLIVGCGTPLVGQLLSVNLLSNTYLILDLPPKTQGEEE